MVEFKASLSQQRPAIRTLVAFANSQGGRVLMGVNNDGTLKGVQIGAQTLETLSERIAQHTYPSLPFHIETAELAGLNVVVVEAPQDTPPLTGLYLYSHEPIARERDIDVSKLEAYRRVGRTTRREDFMMLRSSLPSDPRLTLRLTSAHIYSNDPSVGQIAGRAWADAASGTAHNVRYELLPWGLPSESWGADLPSPLRRESGEGRWMTWGIYDAFTYAEEFSFQDVDLSTVPSTVEVVAHYRDDWGISWQARRKSQFALIPTQTGSQLRITDIGEFSRRIVAFPATIGPVQTKDERRLD